MLAFSSYQRIDSVLIVDRNVNYRSAYPLFRPIPRSYIFRNPFQLQPGHPLIWACLYVSIVLVFIERLALILLEFVVGAFMCYFRFMLTILIPTQIKSTTLDKWDQQYVDFMARVGNIRANSFFEANLADRSKKPYPQSPANLREKYIREKYERRLYCGPPTRASVIRACEAQEMSIDHLPPGYIDGVETTGSAISSSSRESDGSAHGNRGANPALLRRQKKKEAEEMEERRKLELQQQQEVERLRQEEEAKKLENEAALKALLGPSVISTPSSDLFANLSVASKQNVTPVSDSALSFISAPPAASPSTSIGTPGGSNDLFMGLTPSTVDASPLPATTTPAASGFNFLNTSASTPVPTVPTVSTNAASLLQAIPSAASTSSVTAGSTPPGATPAPSLATSASGFNFLNTSIDAATTSPAFSIVSPALPPTPAPTPLVASLGTPALPSIAAPVVSPMMLAKSPLEGETHGDKAPYMGSGAVPVDPSSGSNMETVQTIMRTLFSCPIGMYEKLFYGPTAKTMEDIFQRQADVSSLYTQVQATLLENFTTRQNALQAAYDKEIKRLRMQMNTISASVSASTSISTASKLAPMVPRESSALDSILSTLDAVAAGASEAGYGLKLDLSTGNKGKQTPATSAPPSIPAGIPTPSEPQVEETTIHPTPPVSALSPETPVQAPKPATLANVGTPATSSFSFPPVAPLPVPISSPAFSDSSTAASVASVSSIPSISSNPPAANSVSLFQGLSTDVTSLPVQAKTFDTSPYSPPGFPTSAETAKPEVHSAVQQTLPPAVEANFASGFAGLSMANTAAISPPVSTLVSRLDDDTIAIPPQAPEHLDVMNANAMAAAALFQ